MVSQSWRWSSGLRERGKKEKQGNGRETGASGTWAETDPRKVGLRGASGVQGEKLETQEGQEGKGWGLNACLPLLHGRYISTSHAHSVLRTLGHIPLWEQCWLGSLGS